METSFQSFKIDLSIVDPNFQGCLIEFPISFNKIENFKYKLMGNV